MDNKKIINMNGRVYDPLTSQFLSPDPYVADATNVLGYGRFYVDDDWRGLWQGISRYSWERLQTWAGYNYTQFRNTGGNVDRADYFGGVTYATINAGKHDGGHYRFWTERRAKKRAKKYFKHYGINWNTATSPYYRGTFEDNFPTY